MTNHDRGDPVRIDLHTHSLRSDGSDTPAELVGKAVAADLDVVALTDHDTVEGWDEALAAGEEHGVRVVPGIELSVTDQGPDGSTGRHLLAYRIDPGHPRLAEVLRKAQSSRRDRADALFERLIELDLGVDEARVRDQAGGIPSRKHVAAALVDAGHVADEDDAFSTWLNEGRPAYVSRYRPEIVEAIEIVHAAGGKAVVAHPRDTRRGPGVADDRMAELAEAGLDGIEVDHQAHDDRTREALRELTQRLGLIPTGSSDHHGTRKTDHDLGCNLTEPGAARRLGLL